MRTTDSSSPCQSPRLSSLTHNHSHIWSQLEIRSSQLKLAYPHPFILLRLVTYSGQQQWSTGSTQKDRLTPWAHAQNWVITASASFYYMAKPRSKAGKIDSAMWLIPCLFIVGFPQPQCGCLWSGTVCLSHSCCLPLGKERMERWRGHMGQRRQDLNRTGWLQRSWPELLCPITCLNKRWVNYYRLCKIRQYYRVLSGT